MGQPTLINNVETFANVPPIIRNGGDWFAGIGTEKSKGTKVFALAGQDQQHRPDRSADGHHAAGDRLRDRRRHSRRRASSRRCRPAARPAAAFPQQFLDTPVDYESLAKVGSIMGSGGMIVMDETSCMVDVAKYFMEFCMTESCGKCVPCRVGTVQMHRLLTQITECARPRRI